MLPSSRVWPSGVALATSALPITPPAPDLLSITTDWPQAVCRYWPSRRPATSVVPPGAAGTTIRMVWLGFQAVWAAAGAAAVTKVAAIRPRRVRCCFTLPPIRSIHCRKGTRDAVALANSPHFPYLVGCAENPVPPTVWARAKEEYVKRRNFVSGSA